MLPSTEVEMPVSGKDGEAPPAAETLPTTLWSDGTTLLDRDACDVRVRALSAVLRGMGIRRGRKVGLHMTASGDRICLCLALLSTGAVIVPLDPSLGQARLTMAMQGAALDLLIHDPGRKPAAILLAGVRTLGLGDLAAAATPDNLKAAAPRPDQPAMILYGDGDQDSARGVILTHGAITAAARGLARRLGLTPGHRVAAPLTLNHATRLVVELACLVSGAEIADGPVSATVSHLVVPDSRATAALLQNPPAGATPLVVLAAGEGPVIRQLERLFPGARIFNTYTRAELAGIAICSDPRDPTHTAHTTVGRPLDGVEVMIVDPRTGFDMLLYEIGEIWIRGQTVMQRYYHAPQATRRALDPSGFFRTGDMGYLDSEGRIIVSREAHPQI